MSLRLGFVGLGKLGQPMARRLLEMGHELVVYNRSPEPLRQLRALGCVGGRSPRDVAERCNVVLTAIGLPPGVEEVYLGRGGLVEAARPGLVCVDHSTVSPRMSREIAAVLATGGAVSRMPGAASRCCTS